MPFLLHPYLLVWAVKDRLRAYGCAHVCVCMCVCVCVCVFLYRYDRDQVDDDNGSGVAMGHVTNYAQNENGDVWSLAQYAAHVGQRAFHAMWERILDSVAMVLAAALPRINEVRCMAPPAC